MTGQLPGANSFPQKGWWHMWSCKSHTWIFCRGGNRQRPQVGPQGCSWHVRLWGAHGSRARSPRHQHFQHTHHTTCLPPTVPLQQGCSHAQLWRSRLSHSAFPRASPLLKQGQAAMTMRISASPSLCPLQPPGLRQR